MVDVGIGAQSSDSRSTARHGSMGLPQFNEDQIGGKLRLICVTTCWQPSQFCPQ